MRPCTHAPMHRTFGSSFQVAQGSTLLLNLPMIANLIVYLWDFIIYFYYIVAIIVPVGILYIQLQ